MAKDRGHDREIEELKIRIKRLEEKELRFRRRQQRYEEDIWRREKQGHERFDFYGGIPEFDGKVQDEEFIDWLNKVDAIFEYHGTPEYRKVKLVALKFRKYALIWWENLKKQREIMGKRLIVSWDKMKKELKRKYLSNNYLQDIFLTSQHLKQKEARGGVSRFGVCSEISMETTTSIPLDEAHDDYQEQVGDDKVTLTTLNSDFDSKSFNEEENSLLIEEEGLIKDIKDCALDVLSEIEDKVEQPSNKHVVFEEIPYEGDVQNCFDVINREINAIGSKQLVMAEACKNELEVSLDLPMVTPSKDNEFNLVEEKEDEIRKKLPTYDKVFLQAFTFKDSFSSCFPFVESNEVSEVVLKNGFNCDICSIMQADFEMIPSQFCVIAHELRKKCALMSSLQGFVFENFHKCNRVVFLLDDIFNIDLRTSLLFQPWGNDTGVFKANIMFNFSVEIFHHLVALHTFWKRIVQTIFTLVIFMYGQFVGVYWKMSMSNSQGTKSKLDLRTNLFQQGENDAGASWDSFTQALTSEKPSMLQFKIKEALVVLNDSYDLRLQMRPYELNNSLISWEGSYDASKKILIEEIQEVKIAWKTSYLVTWSTSNCNSIILKIDLKLDKLDAWRTRNNVAWDARNDVSWRARNVFAWKARNLNLAILAVFSVTCVTWTFDIFGNFKTNVRAFQCVYKGLKLIIEVLRDYLMMKKQDCFSNKQDSFLKAVFMHVWLWKIAWQGYERIWHALG